MTCALLDKLNVRAGWGSLFSDSDLKCKAEFSQQGVNDLM